MDSWKIAQATINKTNKQTKQNCKISTRCGLVFSGSGIQVWAYIWSLLKLWPGIWACFFTPKCNICNSIQFIFKNSLKNKWAREKKGCCMYINVWILYNHSTRAFDGATCTITTFCYLTDQIRENIGYFCRGCLLLQGTWSYLRICRRSVMPYTRFCNCLLDYDLRFTHC
jgi:hypothetical protein